MRHLPTDLRTVVMATVLLAGCGSPAGQTAAASQPLSTATQTSRAPTEATPPRSAPADEGATSDQEQAPFVALDQPSEAPGAGSASILGARVGEHEGYERVVLDLQGAAGQQAGWFATAVPQPVQDASGELLNVEGDHYLNVNVTGIANASDGEVDSAGRAAFIGVVQDSGDLVKQVYVGGAWEGQAQVLLGLDDDVTDYRVIPLGDPQRIVIDVRTGA